MPMLCPECSYPPLTTLQKIGGVAFVVRSLAACNGLLPEQFVQYSRYLIKVAILHASGIIRGKPKQMFAELMSMHQGKLRSTTAVTPLAGGRGRTDARQIAVHEEGGCAEKRKSRRTRTDGRRRTAAAKIKKQGAERNRRHSSFPRG